MAAILCLAEKRRKMLLVGDLHGGNSFYDIADGEPMI
jgi:hypothetical protein